MKKVYKRYVLLLIVIYMICLPIDDVVARPELEPQTISLQNMNEIDLETSGTEYVDLSSDDKYYLTSQQARRFQPKEIYIISKELGTINTVSLPDGFTLHNKDSVKVTIWGENSNEIYILAVKYDETYIMKYDVYYETFEEVIKFGKIKVHDFKYMNSLKRLIISTSDYNNYGTKIVVVDTTNQKVEKEMSLKTYGRISINDSQKTISYVSNTNTAAILALDTYLKKDDIQLPEVFDKEIELDNAEVKFNKGNQTISVVRIEGDIKHIYIIDLSTGNVLLDEITMGETGTYYSSYISSEFIKGDKIYVNENRIYYLEQDKYQYIAKMSLEDRGPQIPRIYFSNNQEFMYWSISNPANIDELLIREYATSDIFSIVKEVYIEERESEKIQCNIDEIRELTAYAVTLDDNEYKLSNDNLIWKTSSGNFELNNNQLIPKQIGQGSLLLKYDNFIVEKMVEVTDYSMNEEVNNPDEVEEAGPNEETQQNKTPLKYILEIQLDNPQMKINGEFKEIDPGRGTKPMLIEERTMIPIRSVIESIGGKVTWDGENQQIGLNYEDIEVNLWLDSNSIEVNGELSEIDVAPTTVNSRTLVPIRFIAENFGFNVKWDEISKTVTLELE